MIQKEELTSPSVGGEDFEISGDFEICICAAIEFINKDGKKLIILGHRHGDCFLNHSLRPDKDQWKENDQGFVTSKNRFVSRVEGRQLQEAAGIKSADREGYQGNTLFSEDLY